MNLMAGQLQDEVLKEDLTAFRSSQRFVTMPIVIIVCCCLSLMDVATDAAVVVTWWQAGPSYSTFAAIASGILGVSCMFTAYRGYAFSYEKTTLKFWRLHEPGYTWLRTLLCLLQMHHLISTCTALRAWYDVLVLYHRLGFGGTWTALAAACMPTSIHPMHSAGQDGEVSTSTLYRELLAKIGKLEEITSDGAWWRMYEVGGESIPQLALQSYVLFLTRSFSVGAILSTLSSLVSAAVGLVEFFNSWTTGLLYYNIHPMDIFVHVRATLAFYIFFIGSVGLRVLPLALLFVVWNSYAAVVCGALLLSNFLAGSVFVYTPRPADAEALANSIVEDEHVYLSYVSSPGQLLLSAWQLVVGYGTGNLLGPAPGLAAFGWKWEHRQFSTVANILYRFVECWVVCVLVLLLPAIDQCTPGVSYISCDGCCRGPVHRMEVLPAMLLFSVLFLTGFCFWLPHQLKHLALAPAWTITRRQDFHENAVHRYPAQFKKSVALLSNKRTQI